MLIDAASRPDAQAQASADVERALAALPPLTRSVVWLHDVEGYTHGEIARLLGRTASFSKSQLARAHQRLRELLDPTVRVFAMHARIDHLLSLRDGEPVDAATAAHVEQCQHCSAELRKLRETRAQLAVAAATRCADVVRRRFSARWRGRSTAPRRAVSARLVAAAGVRDADDDLLRRAAR